MSAQTEYGFRTQHSVPGGIIDISPSAIDAFANEEETGVMKYGVAVVAGSDPNKTIKLPTEDSEAKDILGITLFDRNAEHGLEGEVYVRKTKALNVMAYGRIWARVPEGIETKLGDPVYVVVEGDDVGFLTNEDTGVKVLGRFTTPVDKSKNSDEVYYVAGVELFNTKAV